MELNECCISGNPEKALPLRDAPETQTSALFGTRLILISKLPPGAAGSAQGGCGFPRRESIVPPAAAQPPATADQSGLPAPTIETPHRMPAPAQAIWPPAPAGESPPLTTTEHRQPPPASEISAEAREDAALAPQYETGRLSPHVDDRPDALRETKDFPALGPIQEPQATSLDPEFNIKRHAATLPLVDVLELCRRVWK
eukprot:gene12124-biopygen6841